MTEKKRSDRSDVCGGQDELGVGFAAVVFEDQVVAFDADEEVGNDEDQQKSGTGEGDDEAEVGFVGRILVYVHTR